MSSQEIKVKWNGQEHEVKGLNESNTVLDLKKELSSLTNVLPERQKLLGLKSKTGVAVNDATQIGDLNLNVKIMMMGSVEQKIESVNQKPAADSMPEVVNDLEQDFGADEVSLENRQEHLAKIERRVREYQVKVLNEPREGKKLLVLDIDYTIFDHVSHAERGTELMRPYLHEFLTNAYTHYDIAIWSATSMKWIEAKMNEVGVSKHPDYKVTFYLDCGAMITVFTAEYGVVNVKPLKVIWDKYPAFYSAKNTIMFDDLRRNFLMNPQNGLKIEPYKNAHTNRDKDRELVKLGNYLSKISKLDDLSGLNHKYWHKY